MNAYEIIKKPVLSEKSYAGIANKKYVFIVDAKADKTQIKNANNLILQDKHKDAFGSCA